ncbi:LysR substrate-binding domain-containing protein [Comamonas humi]
MESIIHIDADISFRKLEILQVFMATGHLGRTAEQLGISVTSVHRALHSLEGSLRCILFRHEGRNLLPTEAAQALSSTAGQVLHTMADGIRATREIAGYASNHIRIGSLYSLTSHTVPALIIALKQRQHDLHTELTLGSNVELLDKLRTGAIDAALMGQVDHAPDLESQLLFEDDLFFAAPAGSRYATQSAVDLRSCEGERFVSLVPGFATHDRFAQAFQNAGYSPTIALTVGDIFSLMNLVDGGLGYTLLPDRMRSILPDNVRLVPMHPRYHLAQKVVVACLRTRERSPNVLALIVTCRTLSHQLARRRVGAPAPAPRS